MRERRVVQHAQDPRQTLLHRRRLPLKLPDEPLHHRRTVYQAADRGQGGRSSYLHPLGPVLQARVYDLAPVRDRGVRVLRLGLGNAGGDEGAGCGRDELLAAGLDCG